jgi:dephospho-CoA kinase
VQNASTFRVGLTGGIASGKTTAARLFAERGVPVIDTDVLSRELVKPGTESLEEIQKEFGDQVIAPDGSLNRNVVRQLIFADAQARAKLEGILHPRIRAAVLDQSASAGGAYQIIVVPLLFETDFEKLVQQTLLVDCSETLQRERLAERDNETPASIERILSSQMSREQRLEKADSVIDNNGSLDALRRQVELLHNRYTAISQDQHE